MSFSFRRATAYNSNAQIIGVTVQPMVSKKGQELIIGGKTDPVFGPVILFGMGGVGVELFKDYAIATSTTKYNAHSPYDGGN